MEKSNSNGKEKLPTENTNAQWKSEMFSGKEKFLMEKRNSLWRREPIKNRERERERAR